MIANRQLSILTVSGQYDEEYIDYVIEVLRKCRQHGLLVFMDPHQDVVLFKLLRLV